MTDPPPRRPPLKSGPAPAPPEEPFRRADTPRSGGTIMGVRTRPLVPPRRDELPPPAPEIDSDPPPETRRSRARSARAALGLGKYTLVAVGVAAVARLAAKRWWPQGAELLDQLLTGVGL